MIEVTVARLRANLAAILEAVHAGETVVIRRNGTRLAQLTAIPPARIKGPTFKGASQLPTVLDTGPVVPIRLRRRPKRSLAEEISEERY